MLLADILARLRALPEIAGWPEALAYAEGAVEPGGHPLWSYPVAACTSVGGDEEQALPAAAAVFSALASIRLVDDLLDDDPRGEFRRIGAGRAANLALAFQAAGHLLLAGAAAGADVRAALQERFARMAAATAHGQDLDSREPDDEDGYWAAVGAKTPPLFVAALETGALLGGGPPAAVAALGRLGEVMGRFVQVSDDLADALRTPVTADWGRGRGNLAILYAMAVDHPEREAFLALAARAGEPAALAEAQEILARCGAVGYCAYHLALLAREASTLAAAAPLADPEPIARLIAAQREPLQGLLAAIGEDPHPVAGPGA